MSRFADILEIFADAAAVARFMPPGHYVHGMHVVTPTPPTLKAADNARQRARAAREGLCPQCKARPPLADRRLCGHCQALERARGRRRCAR